MKYELRYSYFVLSFLLAFSVVFLAPHDPIESDSPTGLAIGIDSPVSKSINQNNNGQGTTQGTGGNINQGFSGFQEGITRNIISGRNIIGSIKSSNFNFNHKDRINSNRLRSDANGNKISEFKSLPYGQVIAKSNIRHEFTEKELDENNNYYFNARYYDPDLGKFTSVDPVTDNHAFSYVNNNPMKFIDPTGLTLELVGADEQKNTIFSDLSSISGKDSLNLIEEDGRTFIGLSGNQENLNPDGYELVSFLVNHDENIRILVDQSARELVTQVFSASDNFRRKVKVERDALLGEMVSMKNEEFSFSNGPGDSTKVVSSPLSNDNEVFYFHDEAILRNTFSKRFPNTNYDDFANLPRNSISKQAPYIALAHELGHLYEYYKGSPDWNDVIREDGSPSALDPNNERSLGGGVLWENKIRKSKGIEERTLY